MNSWDTIPNCLGEFRKIRENKQKTAIAPYGHPAGTLWIPGRHALGTRGTLLFSGDDCTVWARSDPSSTLCGLFLTEIHGNAASDVMNAKVG